MPPTPHRDIDRLCSEVQLIVQSIPTDPIRSSRRYRERSGLRSTVGGGGKERARLHNQLEVDVQLVMAVLVLTARGVADCLEVAAGRDGGVNYPALSITVRPVLEIAGQVAWLLDDSIDGSARVRRYLTWRFADLKQQRLLLRDFRIAGDDLKEACDELTHVESELIESVHVARWSASPSSSNGSSFEPAALLKLDGGNEKRPGFAELVRRVTSNRAVYALLSMPVHGARSGTYLGLQDDPENEESTLVSGYGVEPNVCIGLTVISLDSACRLIAGWNGVDASSARPLVERLLRDSGIID